MTDGHRQRIGSVVRFGNAVEREQRLDHLLYLKFLGVSMTNNGLFHQPGRVLMNRNRCSLGGKHGYAPNLSELQRYFDIGSKKAIFNGTSLRTVTLNYVRKRIGNFQ